MNFDDLKKSWQENIPSTPAAELEFENNVINENNALMEQVKVLENKRKKRLQKMIFTLGGTIIFISVITYLMPIKMISSYVGLIIMCVAMIGYILLTYFNKIDVNDLGNAGRPTTEFLTKIKSWIIFRKKILFIGFPLYSILLGLGLTLMYIEIFRKASLELKLIVHGVVYIYIIGISIWGIWRENKRIKKETNPILERIDILLGELKTD